MGQNPCQIARLWYNSNANHAWGRGSVGRAMRSQRIGQGFESPRLHQKTRTEIRVFYFERGSSHLLLTRICVLRELCTQNRCHKCRYSVALLTDCRFYQQNQNRPLAVCFNLNFRTNNALHFYFSKCSATFSSNSVTGRCCGHALSQLLHFMQ